MERSKSIEYKTLCLNVLKVRGVASRGASKNIEYQCIKSLAETEIYMGEKSIKSLILE